MDDLLWVQPDWIAAAKRWITTQISSLGLTVIGPLEQFHLYPWSTVIKTPTEKGALYFKAVSEGLKHEIPLTRSLAKRKPRLMPIILAADVSLGWMLMEDAGIGLKDAPFSVDDIPLFDRILPLYAELQQELSGTRGELLKMSVPDRRMQVLPELYKGIIEDESLTGRSKPWGLGEDEYDRLVNLVPHVQRLCGDLADDTIPDSLDHGDFHLSNIFTRGGHTRILDWGDASMTHPFVALRPLFSSLTYHLKLGSESKHFDHLREVYLSCWLKNASEIELKRGLKRAQRISWIVAILRWQTALLQMSARQRRPYRSNILTQFRSFLEANHDLY